MMKKREKPCKRKKCPFYGVCFYECEICAWNPEATWVVKRGKKNE